jgi:3-isopropylmalate dehydrogenase
MEALITALPGDGIGPEVTTAGLRVLEHVAQSHGHRFDVDEHLIGGAAIDAVGNPLPEDSIASCLKSDAVILGAVGGPAWSDPNAAVRPEQGLLGLRARLQVFANLRPVQIHGPLADASPIRAERLREVDLLVVRELTGGIYFGEKTRDASSASDLCRYEVAEVERIVRVAAQLAMQRSKKLCSVDKANVLETSRLWRDVTARIISGEFPELELEHMLVDAAAMHLINQPARFDVIVTENMFGDILTDEASMLSGSMGMLPSASLGETSRGVYEPIHGSAPDIAGRGIANPCGMIASIALMLRHSLRLPAEAAAVEAAIEAAIVEGARTADLVARGEPSLSTDQMTDAIIRQMR